MRALLHIHILERPFYFVRPARAIFREKVVESPFFYVNREHVLIHQTAAESFCGIWIQQPEHQTVHQLGPDQQRYEMSLAGINVAKQNQGPEQNLPVSTRQLEDPAPIELSPGGVDDMSNIRAIESFPTHHE